MPIKFVETDHVPYDREGMTGTGRYAIFADGSEYWEFVDEDGDLHYFN